MRRAWTRGLAVPQVYGPPFVPLAAAATATKRIQLASGTAIGLTRSPFETAMAALDLDHLSQGRFVLRLGTGPVHWTKGYYGMPYDKPVSRLREVVQILRHVEDGARTGTMKPWKGDCYQHCEAYGFGPEACKLQEAAKSMDCLEAARLVPDEMARTFAVCGTPEQVRERIEPLWQLANSLLLLPPNWGLSLEQLAAKTAAIAETFWTA